MTRSVNNYPKNGDFTSETFEETITIDYHIGLRNVNVWDVWIDERATKWKDVRRAIRRRAMDIDEFRATYQGHPSFKYVESVRPKHKDDSNYERQNIEAHGND